jgi:hypothetical protein
VRAVLAALLLVTFTIEGPAVAAGPSAREAIKDLLERRAEALMEGDRSAFMSTVASFADNFRKRQARFFQNIQELPLVRYELRAAWDRYADLVRASDRKRYPQADEIAIPLTEESYQLEAVDPAAAMEDFYYTFVSVEGEWFIASDTDLEDIGLYSARHLWDYGSIDELKSDNFILYGHPCSAACVAERETVLQIAQTAIGITRRYWSELRTPILVLVPGGAEELERMIQATFEIGDFVAFAYWTYDDGEGKDYSGTRIILNPDSFLGRESSSAIEILAHELLHVGTRNTAGPFTPTFVEEGFADYIGSDASPEALAYLNSEIEAGMFDAVLPKDFEFTTGSGLDIFRSYQEAHSVVKFFVERWGLRKFKRFYRRLGAARWEPGTIRYWVDRTMRKTTGIGLQAFERRWADSIGNS